MPEEITSVVITDPETILNLIIEGSESAQEIIHITVVDSISPSPSITTIQVQDPNTLSVIDLNVDPLIPEQEITSTVIQELGPRGLKGDKGDTPYLINEVAEGSIDGINRIFTGTNDFLNGKVIVYWNGLRLLPQDYQVISNNQIRLIEPPLVGDTIAFDYAI